MPKSAPAPDMPQFQGTPQQAQANIPQMGGQNTPLVSRGIPTQPGPSTMPTMRQPVDPRMDAIRRLMTGGGY